VSDDAGHFLCEFIYFRSMEQSVNSRIPVLFCHVPMDGEPFSVKEMTEVILALVGLMVDMEKSTGQNNRVKSGEVESVPTEEVDVVV